MEDQRTDVVVVGGGLAGLVAATTAARAGSKVVVLDGRHHLGGRARSEVHDGFTFNQGPHALYLAGAARRILGDLGVSLSGHAPPLRHASALRGGRVVPAVSSDTLGPRGWMDVLWALRPGLRRRTAGLSVTEWLDRCSTTDERDALAALVRVSTYLADHDDVDAAAVADQLRLAARGVHYLDGGWQSLVDGMEVAARNAGVELVTGERGTGVEASASGVAVTTEGRRLVAGSAIVATGGPGHVDRLLDGTSATVARWAADAHPVVAASLDLALRTLPHPEIGALLGLDEPWYLIPHAPAARLAPDGAALVHAMRYSVDREPDADHRAALEGLMDTVRPGWRDQLVEARFGRHLVVAHDRPRPGVDPADRPTARVPDAPRVFVAGDWITAGGMLADAALSSAVEAARLASAASTDRPAMAVT
jgi:phytoene dehydrogenase-like protein